MWLILACCDLLCGAVSAHTSIPGRCDGDVVLCPALQCAETTAAACAGAVVRLTCFVHRWHRVLDYRHAVVPGYRHNAGATVDRGEERRQRARSWVGKEEVEVMIKDEEQQRGNKMSDCTQTFSHKKLRDKPNRTYLWGPGPWGSGSCCRLHLQPPQ